MSPEKMGLLTSRLSNTPEKGSNHIHRNAGQGGGGGWHLQSPQGAVNPHPQPYFTTENHLPAGSMLIWSFLETPRQ